MTETFHAGPGLGRLSDVTVVHGDCLEAMAELAAGSGTTVEAALLEGFRVIGVEREADYLPMIQQRIARTLRG